MLARTQLRLENIKGNIKTSVKESLGLYELKLHKPWFDKKNFHNF